MWLGGIPRSPSPRRIEQRERIRAGKDERSKSLLHVCLLIQNYHLFIVAEPSSVKKRRPLQSRAENCFWKLLFPEVGFWREYRERSQANDNLLRFSGHLGFPRAKSAFKDHFLHHPVQIMSILSNWVWWGVGGEWRRSVYKCICRAIFRLAVSVYCHREAQWTLNAKMRNTPYYVRVASTTCQEPIRLWEEALACTLVYIVKSGATARNTDSKFASFSWTFGDQIFSVVFDWQCED